MPSQPSIPQMGAVNVVLIHPRVMLRVPQLEPEGFQNLDSTS